MSSGRQKVQKNKETELPEAGCFYWASWRMIGQGANYQHIEITQAETNNVVGTWRETREGEKVKQEERKKNKYYAPGLCATDTQYCWDYRSRKAVFIMKRKKIGLCCSILHQQWDCFHINALDVLRLNVKCRELMEYIRQNLTWVGDVGNIWGALYFLITKRHVLKGQWKLVNIQVVYFIKLHRFPLLIFSFIISWVIGTIAGRVCHSPDVEQIVLQ